MNKKVWKYDNEYWVIHKTVPEHQMTPRSLGYNSDDINKMVRVWVEYLRDNCYGIDKVFNRDGIFLFCEQIKSIDNL
tara:strand:- start:604 stop:834 length:231 start_codon:yes stop_codon:yes gene_type:complete